VLAGPLLWTPKTPEMSCLSPLILSGDSCFVSWVVNRVLPVIEHLQPNLFLGESLVRA
jgi:hypothetical protein